MRAILFYTYDDTFSGSNFLVQKLDNITFDSIVTNTTLTNKTKVWNSAYELIALMDGRCDITMQCSYKRYTTRGPTTTTTPRTTRTTQSTTPRITTTRTPFTLRTIISTMTPKSATFNVTSTNKPSVNSTASTGVSAWQL